MVRIIAFLVSSVDNSTFILLPSNIPSSFLTSSGMVILPFFVTPIIAISLRKIRSTSFIDFVGYLAFIGRITFIYFTSLLPTQVIKPMEATNPT